MTMIFIGKLMMSSVIDVNSGIDIPGFKIHQCDAMSLLKETLSNSIDLVITDPPYESLEKYRSIGTTTRLKNSQSSSNQWFDIFPDDNFEELFIELYRVLKKNSHFYLFCDQETAFKVKSIAENVGFKFWKPLIWDKMKMGMGYHYRARYEFILFFEKGKRKINDLSIPDILSFSRVYKGYPTEKPVELMEVLIRQSSLPGEKVCDPFMGSGAVGRASLKNARHFLGGDISSDAYQLSLSNLKNETFELLGK